MHFLIHTYGCQMNYSDSERISSYLKNLGFKNAKSEDEADLIIFNSCSIRQKAEDRVIGKMKDLGIKKRSKKFLIALTGCMVRKSSTKNSPHENRDHFIRILKPLDIAFRIEDLPKLKDLIEEASGKKIKVKTPKLGAKTLKLSVKKTGLTTKKSHLDAGKSDESAKGNSAKIDEDYFHIAPDYTSKVQAFIPISTGCDKFCTYCIVPYSRGREVSRKMEDVLAEAEELIKDGCLEITLLGQTVDSYGLSNIDRQKKLFNYDKIDAGVEPPPFVQLLEKLDKLYSKGLRRVRFTSPHPKDASQALIGCYGRLKTLMPHIHLPVQAGDNATLKRMNRPYTREHYIEIIKALRKKLPDIAITTDIIVGFCGETEKEFKNTYKLYEELEFDFAFLAQYSSRRGTYATKNLENDVSRSEKVRRWHLLNNLLKKITQEKLQKFVGETVEVLVEKSELVTKIASKNSDTKSGKISRNTGKINLALYRGKTPHMKEVQFLSARKNLKGTIQKVLIKEAHDWMLFGELV